MTHVEFYRTPLSLKVVSCPVGQLTVPTSDPSCDVGGRRPSGESVVGFFVKFTRCQEFGGTCVECTVESF